MLNGTMTTGARAVGAEGMCGKSRRIVAGSEKHDGGGVRAVGEATEAERQAREGVQMRWCVGWRDRRCV